MSFTDLRKLAPSVADRCRRICSAKTDQSNAHFRKVAAGRFPDAIACVHDGVACTTCIEAAHG